MMSYVAVILSAFALVLTALQTCLEPVKAAQEKGPAMRYTAAIGTESKDFERDDIVDVGGGTAGGTLILWVNGDPIKFYRGGLSVLPVNELLRPGRNELTFSGKHKKAVYVKVFKTRGKKVGGPIAGMAGKRIFRGPGGKGKAEPLLFQVKRPPKLPEREELSARAEDRAKSEKEARALVEKLKGLISAHKGKEVARLLNGGRILWGSAAYGKKPEDIKEALEKTDKFFSDPSVKLVDKGKPLQFLFGKRAVLVYTEPPEEPGASSHTFVLERGGKRVYLGPLQLARVGGKWIIWNPD